MRAVKRELHAPGELERGSLLEGWVAGLLKAYGEPGCGLGWQHDALFYWAPAEGDTEVDFLLQRGREFTAIEVKSKDRIVNRDLAGLKTITDLKGVRRRLVVYLGERPFTTEEGIEVLPAKEFLHDLEGGKI